MRKKLIIFIILLITIAVGWFMQKPVATTFAAKEPFENENLCLGEAVALYHDSVNKLFNKNIDLFLTKKEGKDYITNPPAIDPKTGKRSECEDNNISTYCTAMKATSLYEKLLPMLEIHAKRVDQVEATLEGESKAFSEQITVLNQRRAFIDQEIIYAKQTLDTALAAYNEFRMAYPLHKRFVKTFHNLQSYKHQLWNIKFKIKQYPLKFIDITTAKCT